MTRRRKQFWLVSVAALLALTAFSPWIVRSYWSVRAANPVRRGVNLAGNLGCFSCHGDLGTAGLRDPGKSDTEVPGWGGGVWMMYVENDDEIQNYILYGTRERPEPGAADGHQHAHANAIHMPAYEDVLDSGDLDDLVAAFKVLSGMNVPASDSPERRGYDLARKWGCFSCHGPAGSGGYPNPGSFVGFIPGWYGADFRDLVKNREEFDAWISKGTIPRLAENPIASFFIRRQRIPMPAYENLTSTERDELWAYAEWLEETDGGYKGGVNPW